MLKTSPQQNVINPRIRNLITISIVIMTIFCGVLLLNILHGRNEALEQKKLETESLTNSLADHVQLTLISADMNIRRAIERQYFNTLFGKNLNKHMKHQFDQWFKETPQMSALILINNQGTIEIASASSELRQWINQAASLKAGELFSVMQEANDQDVFIGQYRVNQHEHIILARRYTKIDGAFGGIVAALIPSGYFGDFYSTIAFGEKQFMAIELMTNDAKQVFLETGPTNNNIHDKKMLTATSKTNSQDINTTTVNVRTKDYDNSMVIVGSRKLNQFNVVVHVLLSEQDIFEEWNQARARDLGFLILFIIISSILFFFAMAMARQIKRAEESENAAILASQAKSEFLANMSHELRTPLNAIIGYSEMMNSEYFGALNQKQKDRIHDINLCGTHLLQLINDILEFSKGEAGKLELVEEKVDIAEIAGEVIRISNAKARSKNIYLAHSLEETLPTIWADRRKLMQVLLNLLTNAIKFTPEEGHVQLSAYADEHRALHMIVSDTGVGMREEDIPRALSVFGQVHRGHDQEGTGLGLPLCKMYIELHGGKFIVSSRVNAGTKVHIILPHQRSLPNGVMPPDH